MAETLKAKIYMVGSTSAIEVDIKDKDKFLDELQVSLHLTDFISIKMMKVKLPSMRLLFR